ncbi:MAG: type II secretion system GspH family protein [Armatimonadetes bacterium]|nr:type II secretion system GspH family protein [Armatimonadota bacterium]
MTAQRRGFTLIELLVVIGIIAVLAAILFPVFARARESARRVVCRSNLRQVGQALAMYYQDFDEQLMPLAIGYSDCGSDSFYDDAGGPCGRWTNLGRLAAAGYVPRDRLDVLACPDDPYHPTADWYARIAEDIRRDPYGPYDTGCSYAYRGPLDLAATPELAVVCDAMEHFHRAGWQPFHGDGFTVLYADGHVKFIPDHGDFVRDHFPEPTMHPTRYSIVWQWFDQKGGVKP